MTLPTTDVLRLLPHRDPFVLIGELLQAGEKMTETRFLVPADCVLVEDGALSESGLVENMAQTAAAGAGYRALLAGGAAGTTVGYIGALKSLEVICRPQVGEVIYTTAAVLHSIGPAAVVGAEVRAAASGEVMSRCELKIFTAAN